MINAAAWDKLTKVYQEAVESLQPRPTSRCRRSMTPRIRSL